MEALNINPTKSTPKVELDSSKGIFEIGGNSLPENAVGFYQPAISWITTYLANPNPDTQLVFKMQYFNTASSKIIFEIIKMHKSLPENGKTITVTWYYLEDDDDMLETGQDYAELTGLPFEYKILQA